MKAVLLPAFRDILMTFVRHRLSHPPWWPARGLWPRGHAMLDYQGASGYAVSLVGRLTQPE